MAKDFYSILGVGRDASEGEIKKAYRKLAHKHHPDKAGGDEEKFKEASEAYGVLSNKQKKSQYDQFGSADSAGGMGGGGQGSGGFSAQGGQAGGFDFSQFQQGGAQFDMGDLGDVFGNMFSGGGSGSQRGHDLQTSVTITFDEMVHGVKKEITITRRAQCNVCDGDGAKPGTKKETCKKCGGSGHIQRMVQSMLGAIAQQVRCDECSGRGKTFEEVCTECHGEGAVNKNETITVEVPAGISDGQTIALSGYGDMGAHPSLTGDLLVTVRVPADERYERSGDNIVSVHHITFSQAALGDKVIIQTVEGDVKMKIPSGTQSGEVFRVRSKGVPHLRGFGRGDHLVTVIIDTPNKLSRAQKKLIVQLEKEGL